mmetsp:Transcript_22952/g.54355  ORF Transcript_22952/g.54355 Transcript_22952/m.54355 type:complete len:275 (+) Transcript_22952:3887-4711(+)
MAPTQSLEQASRDSGQPLRSVRRGWSGLTVRSVGPCNAPTPRPTAPSSPLPKSTPGSARGSAWLTRISSMGRAKRVRRAARRPRAAWAGQRARVRQDRPARIPTAVRSARLASSRQLLGPTRARPAPQAPSRRRWARRRVWIARRGATTMGKHPRPRAPRARLTRTRRKAAGTPRTASATQATPPRLAAKPVRRATQACSRPRPVLRAVCPARRGRIRQRRAPRRAWSVRREPTTTARPTQRRARRVRRSRALRPGAPTVCATLRSAALPTWRA